jgi:hypothetical protein
MVTQHPLVTKTYESWGQLGNETAKLLGYAHDSVDLDAPTFVMVEAMIHRHFHTVEAKASKATEQSIEEEYPYQAEKYRRIGLEIAHCIDKLCKLYPDSPLAEQLRGARSME